MIPLLAALAVTSEPLNPPQPPAKSVYDFKVKDIKGKNVNLSQYRGKVLLIVNVASKCGNTPQYAGLEKLFREHKKQGLYVLGFPANDFRGQEPGTDAEIAEFCRATYDVSFPMFSKIAVTGPETHPLYRWLLATADRHEDVEWNFAKFLIGRDGKVFKRFSPQTQPDSPEVMEAIQAALAAKPHR